MVLEKTLESPLECKEIQPVHSKGDQSWVFIGRTDAKAETPVLWPPHAKMGGQATYCKVQDEKAMAAVQPSQVVMESGDIIGCQRFGANDLTYRVKQLGYKGRHPGSGT